MSSVDAVRSGLRQYATFSGRARRSEYWWFQLFVLFALAVAVVVDVAISLVLGSWGPVVTALTALGLLVPQLSVLWRRLHDTGRSGVWYLISFVPFGGVVLVVFCCQDSQPHPNQFGPAPKAVQGYGYGYAPQGYGQAPQQH